MSSLDPHSTYLPPQELVSAEESLEGNFSGIGVQFNVPADTAIIINVIPGGPSEKAGVLSGDRIVKVNGKNIAGVKFPQDSMVKLLKGPINTKVNVEIKRSGLNDLLPFTIIRDKIPVKSLDVAFMLNDKLGYMKLSKFSRTTHKEFVQEMNKLKGLGIKELIIDLRDNTGGYLDQALLISNEFMAKGDLIVYMEGIHRKREEFRADGKGICKDIKLYVLINESSASSSEIFTGAIQDNDRGIIMGRRSFGKGLVQEPIYFSDGSGIRLTVARYYTPTGRCIQKPYTDDYQLDIVERYRHGEMTVADSIKKNDSLKFITPKGKTVYGGGGIIPDIFVPIDTVGVTDFLINCNKKSLQIKYSNLLADRYREQLRNIKTIGELDKLISNINIERGFLEYAKENNVIPKQDEWKISGDIILTQLKGLFGRCSPLDDNAFYPYILKKDNVVEKVQELSEKDNN
jgi:C-terminal peptidase (prc)